MNARTQLTLVLAVAAAFAATSANAAQNTLSGWAVMPANTFSDGPTSGQFAGAGAGGNPLPLVDKQPVQGFSGVLAGANGSFRVITDNGFGAQGNSADTLLRSYAVNVDFRTALGGSGTVSAANWNTGASLPAFNAASRITLSDPKNLLSIKVQADYTHYYNNAANPLVDPSIKAGDTAKTAELVETRVLPHFNFTRMTALALGKEWRATTPEQKKVLTEEFRTLLVRTYSNALTSYRNQTVDYRPFKMGAADTDVTVRTQINQPGWLICVRTVTSVSAAPILNGR